MNMKKAIAALLVIWTMTMTGAAFAGSRFHGGQHRRSGFESKRLEQRGHYHNNQHNSHWGQRHETKLRHNPYQHGKNSTFSHKGHRGPQQRHGRGHDMRGMRGRR